MNTPPRDQLVDRLIQAVKRYIKASRAYTGDSGRKELFLKKEQAFQEMADLLDQIAHHPK